MAEGSVRWKNSKDKRVCVMCHNGDRSSAFGFLKKRQHRQRRTNRQTGREREKAMERRRDDQKDCSHNDEVSDWTDAVSIQFALRKTEKTHQHLLFILFDILGLIQLLATSVNSPEC